jgi:polyketide synthase 5
LTPHRASTIVFSASANLIALEADTGIRLRAVDVTTVRAMADALSGAMQESQPAGADGRD